MIATREWVKDLMSKVFKKYDEDVTSNISFWIENGYLPDPKIMPLIPVMTSNTTPKGVASASSIYNENFNAWCAFRNSDDLSSVNEPYKRWNSANTAGNGEWLKYEFENPVTCRSFKICPLYFNGASYLKSYKLQGSNNDSNWDDLYSETLENVATNKQVTITNNTAYKYYRLLATSNSYDSSVGCISIINFQLYAK